MLISFEKENLTSSNQLSILSVFRSRISFIIDASLFLKSEKKGPIHATIYPVVVTIIIGFSKDLFLYKLKVFRWN